LPQRFTHSDDSQERLQDSDEQSDSLTNLTASQTHLGFLQAGFLRSLHLLPQSLSSSLEDAAPPPLVSPHPIIATASIQQQRQVHISEKKNVRACRVPKGVVPGVTPPPDPERWLKKSERTNIHYHNVRRRKGATGGTTQGSLVEGGSKGSGGASKGKKKR
jgi:signal recognition particle subunit SRP72